MRDVDLRLAISYVPGAVCLLKIAVLELSLLLAESPSGSGFVVIGAMLWLDSHYQSPIAIVDCNSLLCSIYGSRFVHQVRDGQSHGLTEAAQASLLSVSIAAIWSLMCVYTILTHIGWVTDKRSTRGVRCSMEMSCVFISTLAFCTWTEESILLRLARVFFFGVFCLLWRYAIDLRDLRGCAQGQLRVPITILFLPMLYTPLLVTIIFWLVNSALFCSYFVGVPGTGSTSQFSKMHEEIILPTVEEEGPTLHESLGLDEPSHEALEKLLRDAKARSAYTSV